MAVIAGVRYTGAIESTNVKPDVDTMLKVIEPYQTPTLHWLMFVKKDAKVVKNKYGKFEWFEREFFPHQTSITAAITESSGLTLTSSNVSDVTIFNIGDIVYVEETDQMAVVSSGTVGTSVVLTHIDGSTSLTSLSSTGSFLKIIGSKNYEYTATSGRVAMTVKEVNKYNYLNEFNEYISTSGREEAGEAYTDGLSHDELLEQKVKEMKLQVERYFYFSNQRGYTSSGNQRATYGYGLKGMITTNVTSYSGTLGETAWDSYNKTVYAKGTNRKKHFAGSDQIEELHKFMKERYELSQAPNEKALWGEYGIEVKSYRTPFGITDIIWNPILDGKFTDWGFTLDDKTVRMRFMANDKNGSRKFRIRDIDQLENEGSKSKILMDVAIEISQEQYSGILYQS